MFRTFIALIFIILLASHSIGSVDKSSVSLKYLMDKNFNGAGLKLVKVLAQNNIYTRYYITYNSADFSISGIMNVPKGKGPFPVIITNHGFIDTKYYTNGRGLKREQDYLARHGYAVLHPDYRNHNGSSKDPDNDLRLYAGYIEDVINAAYAIKNSNFNFLDKNNIGMLGHSLGGGIALSIMAVKPGLIKAYVLFAPISIDYRDNFERWIARRNTYEESKVAKKYGPPQIRHKIIEAYGTPDTNPSFWDGLSVKTYLNMISDPVIIHHGTSDKSVPLEWSEKLNEALKSADKESAFYIYKGEPHEFINAWPLVMKRSLEFFDGYLKK